MRSVTPAAVALLLATGGGACSSFDLRASGDGGTDARATPDVLVFPDARTSRDSGGDATRSSDATSPSDARPTDAGVDTGSTARDAAVEAAPRDAGHDTSARDAGGGMDPLLALPSPDASVCSPIGNIQGSCALGDCLIAGPSGDAGRCKMCSRTGSDCGGHATTQCTVPEDCDIDWDCYAGFCVLTCRLSLPQTCGAGTCTNVGNPVEGVCVAP